MADEGKIVVSGFKLDEAEKTIVDNLINNYKRKILEKINFSEIRLRMKKSAHGKVYLHEIQGTLIADKQYTAKVEDYNLFAALSDTLEKLMHEAEHSRRTNRQEK